MNETACAVLNLLRRTAGPCSGEAVGRALGISRSAVSKHIAALRRAGYAIESVPRRGHRLQAGSDTPRPEEVAPLLQTRTLGRTLRFLDSTDSTNAVAAREAANGAPEGTVIVADAQTAGRGRQHRTWTSPAGCNLYFSLVLRPRVEPARIAQLSLVAAVAVHQALLDLHPELPVAIKWPNDLLDNTGRKLCGILCEAALEADAVHHAIVGIGLNVNARKFPAALRTVACSLRTLTGADTARPAMLAAILNRFEPAYTQWQAAPDLGPFLPYLEKFSALNGRRVKVHGISKQFTGRVEGLAPHGELLLRDSRNTLHAIACGDVHLEKKS